MNKKTWEKTYCNNCHENTCTVVYDKVTNWEYPGMFRIVKCNNCALHYINPRPNLQEIGQYYVQDNYWGRDFTKNEKRNDKKERRDAYQYVYTYIDRVKKKGTILDIGAGTGLFLSYFKEKGWNIDGVELSKEAVFYAKKRFNVRLKNGDFLEFPFKNNTYDVITLNGVLEHLHTPHETLEKAAKVLKKDGIIIISVPNVESVGRFLFGRHWLAWMVPRHLYHFSPKTISDMLDRSGFTIREIRHDYWAHNYYTIFNSLRYAQSPRFEKKAHGGLQQHTKTPAFSLKKTIGKLVGVMLATSVALIEPLIGKGEILIVYAEKKQ